MIKPNLALDFTTGVLDPQVTFTRAGNTATVTNSSGLIAAVNANLPRFDYDPVTLASKGLLIEEQRTNLFLWSDEFDNNVVWTKQLITVVANDAISPDGTTDAEKVTDNSGSGCELTQTITVTSGATVAHSRHFKYIDCRWVRLVIGDATNFVRGWYDVQNGVVGSVTTGGTGSSASIDITPAGNGWYRCILIGALTGATSYPCLGMTALANASAARQSGGSYHVWGAQLEAGAFATSYIPTTTTALTRNADVATITDSNFTSFWNATQGGATVQATPSTVSGIRPLVQYDDGTANEIIALRGNTTNPELYIVDGGTPQAQLDAGTIAANTAYSLTGWWAVNDCRARKDSGAAVTDATATIPTVTQARIGSDGTNYLNGTIATINYYAAFSSQIYTRRKNKVVSSLF